MKCLFPPWACLLLMVLASLRPATGLAPVPPLVVECLAGYVGGVAKQACNHPFELVATLTEARRGSDRGLGAVQAENLMRHPQKLYSGFVAAAIMNMPYAVLFHTSLYFSTAALVRLGSTAPNSAAISLLAGAFAAAAACVVGVPLEVVKHRMQVTLRGRGYETPWRALCSAMADSSTGGLKGLYTGLPTTLLRNVPYNAVQFGTFNLLLNAGAGPLLAGASAGVATAVVTTPIDVVNTRLQTQAVTLDKNQQGNAVNRFYAGPFDAVRTMAAKEGIRAFWRGTLPRTAGYAPSALVFFWVYRLVHSAL